jgi:predicted permease
MAAYAWQGGVFDGSDLPERVAGCAVSPALFALLRTAPVLGRPLRPEEEQPGREGVVVLGHGLWQRRFQGSPAVLGRVVSIDDRPHTVVGVMPEGFEFPVGVEYWTPLAVDASHRVWTKGRIWNVLAGLRSGVSLEEAQAEMTAIAARIAQDHPETNEGMGVRLLRLGEMARDGATGRFVAILHAAAAFVLLLACVNVSNLLLARATTRQHEMAVRVALGAGRLRVARLFLLEGLSLSALGALFGGLLGAWGVQLAKATIPAKVFQFVPGLRGLRADGTVFVQTAAIAAAAGVACGLVAAWHATRPTRLREGLAEGGRGRVAGRGVMGQVLVVAEVALALVLLVGAGVMARTYALMAEFDVGLDPKNVVQASVTLPESRYPDPASVRRFADDALARLAAVPGVVSVAAGPVGWGVGLEGFQILGEPPAPRGTGVPVCQVVTPGYFAALKLKVTRGRGFVADDEAPGKGAVLVASESVVRRYFRAGSDPVGATVGGLGHALPPLRVVGVVGDVKDWFTGEPRPIVYVLNSQLPQRSLKVFARASGDAAAVMGPLRLALQALDRSLPVEDLWTVEEDLRGQSSGVRLAAGQMGVFALIALVLAATGIYAVMAFAVAQRTRELGVRLALGARAEDLLRMVLGQSLRTAGIGLALGGAAAFALMRAMAHVLYGVVKVEMPVFAGVVALLVACAALAAWVPARQAARVDPLEALRAE